MDDNSNSRAERKGGWESSRLKHKREKKVIKYPFIKKQIRVLEIGADGMEGIIRSPGEQMKFISVESAAGISER